MTLDGALFDLAKVKNICKERLAHLNKDDFTALAYDWACKYNEELKGVIDRNPDYFKSIINIEREKENPRKDYEKFSDILPIINFMYDDYYEQAIKEELPWNEAASKETIKAVLEDYKNNMNLDLTEEEWFEKLKELAVRHNYCPNVKEYKKNKEAYNGHIGDVSEIIRIAMSGKKNTPNLYYALKILGEERLTERFNKIASLL
jgi:glutamyl-tRNA synthetase